jgi:hypothetical protein
MILVDDNNDIDDDDNNEKEQFYIFMTLPINLKEPFVLYIGRAYRYPPDVAFYIFFQQI